MCADGKKVQYPCLIADPRPFRLNWQCISALVSYGTYPHMSKPFHLMTPAERTAARIAQNRAISEKVGEGPSPKPPIGSSREFIRGTPEERAKFGSVIRKVQP